MSPITMQCQRYCLSRGIQQLRLARKFHEMGVASKRFRVLFLGRDEFSATVLKEVYQAKDVWREIVCLTQREPTPGTSKRSAGSPLGTLAKELGLQTHRIPLKRRAFRNFPFPEPFVPDTTTSLASHYILVTASFGRILTDAHLGIFQPGRRLNVHPSLLPKYRGPAPIQHTIINEDEETGVCVIEMTKKSDGIDAGQLWNMQRIPTPPMPYFTALRDDLARLGGQLLVSTLRSMIDGTATSTPQPSSGDMTPAPLIKSTHAQLDFATMTAPDIHRLYRAISHQKALTTDYLPPSSAVTPTRAEARGRGRVPLQLTEVELLSHDLPQTTLHLLEAPGSYAFSKATRLIYVRCSDGSILVVKRLKPAGGKNMDALAFWNGIWAAVGREKKRKELGLAEETDIALNMSEEGLWVFGGALPALSPS